MKGKVVTKKLLVVVVANGWKMIDQGGCNNVSWTMQDHQLCCNLRVIKLGCYGIILEVDWMKQYSPMKFDFINSKVNS